MVSHFFLGSVGEAIDGTVGSLEPFVDHIHNHILRVVNIEVTSGIGRGVNPVTEALEAFDVGTAELVEHALCAHTVDFELAAFNLDEFPHRSGIVGQRGVEAVGILSRTGEVFAHLLVVDAEAIDVVTRERPYLIVEDVFDGVRTDFAFRFVEALDGVSIVADGQEVPVGLHLGIGNLERANPLGCDVHGVVTVFRNGHRSNLVIFVIVGLEFGRNAVDHIAVGIVLNHARDKSAVFVEQVQRHVVALDAELGNGFGVVEVSHLREGYLVAVVGTVP